MAVASDITTRKTGMPAPAQILAWRGNLLRQSWQFNRFMTIAIVFQIVLVPLILLGMWLDPKTILGAPAWNKPLKFALSGAIYGATFLWLLTFIQGRRLWVQLAANATAFALIGEQLLINLQVVRGVPSHFNAGSTFDGIVYGIMGALIFTLSAFNLLLALGLMFQRLPDRTLAWALRFGVLASFAAMGVGSLMTGNTTPAQLAAIESSGMSAIVGAHTIGVEMGGPGLPFVGWSTVGGDLRPAHFVGLHGMQAVPLLAGLLLVPGLRRRLSTGQRTGLVITGGIGYLAWTGLLTWQALRGVSVVALDGPTALAYGALLGSMAMAALVILRWGGRARRAV